MNDYEPLDISPICNAGPDLIGSDARPTGGEQLLRGIPFRIGSVDAGASYVAFGPTAPMHCDLLTLPVERSAAWMLFAHAMVESRLHEGDPPGRVVATYRMVFEDGQRVEVPIRERFEIGALPVGWGELPFLALPDRKDSLHDRYQGEWQGAGFRQCEARQAWPNHYYLWAWRNPRPKVAIARLEVEPWPKNFDAYRPRFFIAGVTVGHLDEEPLAYPAAVPVKLTTTTADKDPVDRFDVVVEVDRGVATYPFRLPAADSAAFLADEQHRGWGEAQNQSRSPAYVEIAAIPSATVTVKQADEKLGEARWSDIASGPVSAGSVRIEIVDTGRNWVHTTVRDADTGKPVPCRIHFRSAHGIPYAPHGHHPHVNSNMGTWHIDVGGDVRLGQITYAYIDGKCQGWLPRGEVIVDVARGYEYEPLRTAVEVRPGQRELDLTIRRKHNMNAERYFSGDTHVHFLSSQGAVTEAAAEDLDVVNLLMSQWGHLFTNTEEFTGKPLASGDGETIVYASQENRQHLLGHLTLLGLKEMVMPWCSDGPSEAEMGGNLETMLCHWADACHAQGGTVVIPHLPNPNGEPAALIATGRADAVEMLIHSPYFHLEYYRYLNGGFRLPLAGGTDKMDSGVPVGMYRTYAYIPPDQPFTYDTWCAAFRSGNTFLSGGPMIRLIVEGQPMGSTVQVGAGGTVEVEALATSILPIHSLELVRGGAGLAPGEIFRIVDRVEEKSGTRELRLRARVKVDGAGWMCARCAGPGYEAVRHHDSWRRGIMAHTSPVYLAAGAKYNVCSPDTMRYMLALLDGSLQYVHGRAPQWRPGTTTHHHGEEDHTAFLERPLQEAIAAVHRKMHEHGIAH